MCPVRRKNVDRNEKFGYNIGCVVMIISDDYETDFQKRIQNAGSVFRTERNRHGK